MNTISKDNGGRRNKKSQQCSVGTATETITVLDRTAPEVVKDTMARNTVLEDIF